MFTPKRHTFMFFTGLEGVTFFKVRISLKLCASDV